MQLNYLILFIRFINTDKEEAMTIAIPILNRLCFSEKELNTN